MANEGRTAEDAMRDIDDRARTLFIARQWESLPARARANYRLAAAAELDALGEDDRG